LIVAGTATAHKHTDLELALIRLADAQAQTEVGFQRLERNIGRLEQAQERTDANLDRLEASLGRHSADTKANLDRYIADNDKRFADLAEKVDRANKNAGEAVNQAGRLVEDIVAPSLHDFFRATFKWNGPLESAIRLNRPSRISPDEEHEFDAFVAGGDTLLLVSVKSTVSPNRITELLADMATVRDFFPETQNRKAHGAMASLYIDSSVVTKGEREGLLMIGLQPGLITVLNSPGFKPREF
jgi:hypothetical protein